MKYCYGIKGCAVDDPCRVCRIIMVVGRLFKRWRPCIWQHNGCWVHCPGVAGQRCPFCFARVPSVDLPKATVVQ